MTTTPSILCKPNPSKNRCQYAIFSSAEIGRCSYVCASVNASSMLASISRSSNLTTGVGVGIGVGFYGFVGFVAGDELPHRLRRIGADHVRYSPAQRKQGTRKTGIEQKQRMLGLDAPGIDIDLPHLHRFALKGWQITMWVRRVGEHNVAQFTPISHPDRVSMPGEIEEQTIFRSMSVPAKKLVKG